MVLPRVRTANFSLIYPTKQGLIGGEGTTAPVTQPVGQSTGDAYVIAPAGLLLRLQPNAGAGASGGVVFGQHLTALGAESAVDGTGRSWQQVKTDAGVVAFVAASMSGDRLLSKTKPADPYVVQVIDAQPIRDAGGLALRDARNIALNLDRSRAGQRTADRLPTRRRSEWHALAVGEVIAQSIWLGA